MKNINRIISIFIFFKYTVGGYPSKINLNLRCEMKTKRVFYKSKGHDDESFIFIDQLDDGTRQIRVGESKPVSHFKWKEDSVTMSVEEFLAGNAQYRPRVAELILEFESEQA